jgi:PAS domain S-box-containing protein
MLRDAVAEGKPVELECKILTSGGVDRNVLIKGAVQTDETGAVVRLYGTVQDITEKKMAEEQLRIQRDLAVEVAGAETLEESAAMSVFGALEITSTDCGALFLRRNERENLQVLFREGFPDSIIDLLIDRGRIYLEPRNTESRASFEIPEDIRGPLKFITVFPLRYHTIPFGFLAVGSVDKVRIQEVGARAMESLAAQISNGLRQKLSEYARRLSEQRYRGLFKSMMNGVTRTDEEGRYKEANEAFLRMVGYSEEELRKLTYRDITPEDWVEGEREILAEQVTRNGYTEEYEKEYIRKDGSRVPVSVRIWSTRRPDTGEDEYWAVVRDITERKESERLIERAMNDLKRSNEELKDFAYIASHDLQEPLRSITGFSELLSRRYGDRLDEDGTRFLELVMSAARRMQRLIEDLLSYSRLNTRAKPFEQIDTEEVVETVKLNLVIIIQEKNAEIIVHPLPPVQGDPAQITQLFQNLIGNAIKYGREGVPPRIEISCTDKGGVWHFSVADNGIGIEEEHLEVIFKMFQRLHGREEYSGTGIGLALCKRIVERHGGVLWAESTYGEGTIFHFTLSKQP